MNMTYTHHYLSPLGDITMASDGHALTGLWFDGQRHFAGMPADEQTEIRLPLFDETGIWLDLYFSGQVPDFTLPLAPEGTPFRMAVWERLLTIPYGTTITYGQIAREMAEHSATTRMSAQAVGNAVGHNPISLIIPCHRVIGTDGSLTGYAGGLDRKRALLALERDTITKK